MGKKAYLILEDGLTLEGEAFGHDAENIGEVVFNTSMSGYQEVLTDPSYCGQIVTMTYTMMGNYGINPDDIESAKVQVAGFAVREYSRKYSNFRATTSLEDYLVQYGIPAIQGIDTRRLTLHIRDKGALRGGIFHSTDDAIARLQAHPVMNGLDLASRVSCAIPYNFGTHEASKPLIAVMDYGVKTNILRLLDSHGFSVRVYPGNTPFETIRKDGVKGIFLSNGPGDPEAVKSAPELVQNIVKDQMPCFGICLGHQLLGIGLGARTYKLKFGHRGGNQPVKNLKTGHVEITSQNHGFAVDYEAIRSNPDIEITHMNLNDNTVEGFSHKKLPIFCVQYHPEAAPGPHDSVYLFEQFRRLVG